MNKILLIEKLLLLHEKHKDDAKELVMETFGSLLSTLFERIDCEADVQELVNQLVSQLQPIEMQALRKIYDDMYTEDELRKLARFHEENPWFLERAMEQHRRLHAVSEKESAIILEKLFQPYKYKIIKDKIMDMLSDWEFENVYLNDIQYHFDGEFSKKEIAECYNQLATEGKLKGA